MQLSANANPRLLVPRRLRPSLTTTDRTLIEKWGPWHVLVDSSAVPVLARSQFDVRILYSVNIDIHTVQCIPCRKRQAHICNLRLCRDRRLLSWQAGHVQRSLLTFWRAGDDCDPIANANATATGHLDDRPGPLFGVASEGWKSRHISPLSQDL
ncbi:uncharacterized protein LY79DRAFT_408439 [Colletotrichum navitas]|uniref:Uncharacterized protein n=1 Tax=Colletotrichum navitas TaxID=681940 RepID=A0AAD8Q8K7_9PEZI|nr:uncharacterized protein LY79DRAFT_408439 [Colletotrichum navitas]KAK1597221.1 hypothetical protein LY79DRAFT_408439 [Colletotrichum navitas]